MVAIVARFSFATWGSLGLPVKSSDFRLYFAAARIGTRAGWAHIYDTALQRQSVSAIAPGTKWLPFVTPPPLAWLIAPLTLVPYPVAVGVWSSLVVAAGILASQLAAQPGLGSRSVIAASLIAFPPFLMGIGYGQVVMIVMLSLVACWVFLRIGRDVIAGIALAGILFKPQLAFLVPVALITCGRRRAALGFAGTGLALAAAAALSLNASGVDQYQNLIKEVAALKGQRGLTFLALIGPLGVPAGAALGVTALLVARRHRRASVEVPMAVATLASVLLTPYLNLPDFVILLVPGWLLLRGASSPWEVGILASAWVVAAMAFTLGTFFMYLAALALGVLTFLRVPMPQAREGGTEVPDHVGLAG
ncbi:MAG: glycosyltransferase family 87 protein [Candidatus Dormibacterales bacterium]